MDLLLASISSTIVDKLGVVSFFLTFQCRIKENKPAFRTGFTQMFMAMYKLNCNKKSTTSIYKLPIQFVQQALLQFLPLTKH